MRRSLGWLIVLMALCANESPGQAPTGFYCPDTSGASNTITCSTYVALVTYKAGIAFDVLLANSVTGATVMNVDGLGNKAVTYNGTNPMVTGIMVAGGTYRLQYDGTEIVLQGTVSLTAINLVGNNPVSFSATPTFNLQLGNLQTITLTGNVTSSSLANITAGNLTTFLICQDGTGGRTFVWPATVLGAMTIGATASKCSSQSFISNGTNLYAIGPGILNM